MKCLALTMLSNPMFGGRVGGGSQGGNSWVTVPRKGNRNKRDPPPSGPPSGDSKGVPGGGSQETSRPAGDGPSGAGSIHGTREAPVGGSRPGDGRPRGASGGSLPGGGLSRGALTHAQPSDITQVSSNNVPARDTVVHPADQTDSVSS